jgi:hypothetical protein
MAKPTLASRNLARPLEYNRMPWGDLIYATKDQLRAIGIGVDAEFPGETGNAKRRVTVRDPRGFRCQIENCDHLEEGIFSATIRFPGREQPEPQFEAFAPGVRRLENIWSDDYLGTAEALAAAGLIQPGQLPGQPGMRKSIVTILPDGSVPRGPSKTKGPGVNDPGAKRILRAAKGAYLVSVLVESHERARRHEAYAQSRCDWEERMRALPQPARLDSVPSRAAWSARAMPACRTVGNVVYLPGA